MDASIAALIDHTLLKPDATATDIRQLCAEARKYGFAAVCVNPCWVKLAWQELTGSEVSVCTVVGFPLGANATETKVFETILAIEHGAREIDMVLNIGELKGHNEDAVSADISAVVEAAHARGVIVKVILETALLHDTEKAAASRLAQAGGRRFREDVHRIRTWRGEGGRRGAAAARGGTADGRESVGRDSHVGRFEKNGGRRSVADRRERQRANYGRNIPANIRDHIRGGVLGGGRLARKHGHSPPNPRQFSRASRVARFPARGVPRHRGNAGSR